MDSLANFASASLPTLALIRPSLSAVISGDKRFKHIQEPSDEAAGMETSRFRCASVITRCIREAQLLQFEKQFP